MSLTFMSLFRTGIKPLCNINILILDDHIKLKTNLKIPPNQYIFNHNIYKYNHGSLSLMNNINDTELKNNLHAIRIEDLKKLQLNKNIKSYIKSYENNYQLHKKIISQSSDKLKSDIYKYTSFETNFEYWNITNLARKYNIDGRELFLTMTENTKKYQDNWNDNNIDEEYKYFGYCENYGLKNQYPVNIYKSQTKLNLRRYVDRSGINGYYKLINLFETKNQLYSLQNTDETIDENIDENTNENENKPINKMIYNSNSNVAKIQIPSMNLDNMKIDYSNQNLNNLSHENPIYPLDINLNDQYNEFNKYLSEGKKNKIFDLDRYFTYVLRKKYYFKENDKLDESDLENYILTPLMNIELENISIVNCIIFGESNIRYSDVEKLLSLIRFGNNLYSYTLDNFTISHYSNHYLTINSDDLKINSLNFCEYSDMLECAKWLIQIMNQINPAQINHHNYHIIVSYCKYKDNIEEQNFNNLVSREKMRIEENTFDDV